MSKEGALQYLKPGKIDEEQAGTIRGHHITTPHATQHYTAYHTAPQYDVWNPGGLE
jgi:hypothetical protein